MRTNCSKNAIIRVDNKEVRMNKSKLPRDIAETAIEMGAIFVLCIVAILVALILTK